MQVYISHADSERKLAKELATTLSEAGFSVWLDEQQVFPGDNWALKIGRALQRSEAMVVLVSPNWAKSERGTRELEYALGSINYQNRVVPVLVKPTRNIPWILKHLNYYLEMEDDWPGTKGRIVEALRRPSEVAG